MEADRQFTYLVPSASAWEKIKDRFATAHKQLFMGSFAYHSQVRTGKIRIYFYLFVSNQIILLLII